MPSSPEPTGRELAILKVLWEEGEASVRAVYEDLRNQDLPIVQNTVQAFLRTMEEKGLVTHRVDGRAFIYRPLLAREGTSRNMLAGVLERVFDGAMDQLVESALSVRRPTAAELARLRALLVEVEQRDAGAPDRDGARRDGARRDGAKRGRPDRGGPSGNEPIRDGAEP